jgi:hypothetical protein
VIRQKVIFLENIFTDQSRLEQCSFLPSIFPLQGGVEGRKTVEMTSLAFLVQHVFHPAMDVSAMK